MTRTRIVVLFGSGQDNARRTGLPGERSVLHQLIDASDRPVHVAVISFGTAPAPRGVTDFVALDPRSASPVDRVLRGVGAYAIRDALSRTPIGRLLNSMGPVDQGRVFWRALRRSPEALSLIRGSTAVIAADLASVKSAWIARRRGWVGSAHYDHRSAALGDIIELPELG